MGSGSPAARAVADIILLNNSFDLLPSAMREGRRIINSMMMLVRLFLIRDAAALELIFVTTLVGTPFPLLPPHAALIALLTVGIPSVLIVAWAGPDMPRNESLSGIAADILEIGTISALAIGTAYALALGVLQADIVQTRTATVTAAVMSGLAVLIVFRHPLDAPLSLLISDRRYLALVAALFAVYIGSLYWPTWQYYFELKQISPFDWAWILSIVVAWFFLLHLGARILAARRPRT